MDETITYGWVWIDGEDADAGNSWIEIGPLDSEGYVDDETATIMCRDYTTVKRDHPEWIAAKETAANLIVTALNFYAEHGEYVAERGTE